MIQLYHQIIHYSLGRTYYKMSISEKINAINNKIEQNKAQYNLDRQTAKMSTLSSEDVSKYEFLTSEDVLPEKYLQEKENSKRFEYSPLDKESKAQASVPEKQYQKVNKIFKSNDEEEEPVIIGKEEPAAI